MMSAEMQRRFALLYLTWEVFIPGFEEAVSLMTSQSWLVLSALHSGVDSNLSSRHYRKLSGALPW
jgi:hypothetical protein